MLRGAIVFRILVTEALICCHVVAFRNVNQNVARPALHVCVLVQTLDHQAEGEREEICCDEEAAREGAENARKEVRLWNIIKNR